MSTNYPGAADVYSTKVTGATIQAADVNNPQAAIIALEQNGQQVFNVKTFGGAKGDGVTDDTVAFRNTLNAAAGSGAIGVGVMYIPPGKYIITGQVQAPTTLANGIIVMGAGREVTMVNMTAINTTLFKFTLNPGRIHFLSFADMTLLGPNAGTSGYAIDCEGDITFSRVEIRQFWTACRIFNCFYGFAEDSFFGLSVQDGVFLDTNTTTWESRMSRYSGCGRYGIYSPSSCYHLRLFGDYIESNSSRGVYYDANAGSNFSIAVIGCYFESALAASATGLYIGPTFAPQQVTIIGSRWTDESTSIVQCDLVSCQAAFIAGNNFGTASGVGGQSLQIRAAAKNVVEMANWTGQRANRISGCTGYVMGQSGVGSGNIPHIVTYSSPAPGISGVAAGISGTPAITGTDTAGLITFTTTGTPPAAGATLFTVTYSTAYGAEPTVILQNANSNLIPNPWGVTAGNTASFGVFTPITLANTTAYKLYFHVLGQGITG